MDKEDAIAKIKRLTDIANGVLLYDPSREIDYWTVEKTSAAGPNAWFATQMNFVDYDEAEEWIKSKKSFNKNCRFRIVKVYRKEEYFYIE